MVDLDVDLEEGSCHSALRGVLQPGHRSQSRGREVAEVEDEGLLRL